MSFPMRTNGSSPEHVVLSASCLEPFHVAEVFTGTPGKYVTLGETIAGFKRIVDVELDELPEQAFYMVGTIEEALEKAEKLALCKLG